jgi:ATP-dependent helicase HrpA
MHYEIEEDAAAGTLGGVVRLQLPEKLARTLVDEELPELDRPIRFAVSRGGRGTIKADTLAEVQELLDRPWMESERQESGRRGGGKPGNDRPRSGPPGRSAGRPHGRPPGKGKRRRG